MSRAQNGPSPTKGRITAGNDDGSSSAIWPHIHSTSNIAISLGLRSYRRVKCKTDRPLCTVKTR